MGYPEAVAASVGLIAFFWCVARMTVARIRADLERDLAETRRPPRPDPAMYVVTHPTPTRKD